MIRALLELRRENLRQTVALPLQRTRWTHGSIIRLGASGGIAVAMVGVLVFVGWVLDVPALKTVATGLASMRADTALGFVFAGLAIAVAGLAPARNGLRIAFAAVPLLLGVSALAEYALNADFGIEGRTVLVVEDNVIVRAMIRTMLADLGYRAVEAANGKDALLALGEAGGRIDALLTDMVLPGGMSGNEIAAALRQRAPSVKVVMMTGYASEVVQRRNGHGNGGSILLNKPFRKSELAEALARAMADAESHAPA